MGVSTLITRKHILPLTEQWQPQSKRKSLVNIQYKLWSPHHQGDIGHNKLRKEVADIHAKNTLHTKNIKPTQPTQGHSHIKIVLQDHSRWLFLLNSQSKRNISKTRKQRNYSQWNDQENATERANNKTGPFSLTDTEFKTEIMNTLNELRTIHRNANCYRKQLETIKGNKEN